MKIFGPCCDKADVNPESGIHVSLPLESTIQSEKS